MKYFKKMESENLYLAPMMVSDAEKYCEWMNDKEVTDGINKTKDVTTFENEIEYLENVCKNGTYAFSIVKKDNDKLIGSCTLMHSDFIAQTAEIGIAIGEKASRGKGYGVEVIKMLLEYGFNTLNLNAICLEAYSFNENALKCYKKAGFREVGKKREAGYQNGKRCDIIIMDMLRSEYEG